MQSHYETKTRISVQNSAKDQRNGRLLELHSSELFCPCYPPIILILLPFQLQYETDVLTLIGKRRKVSYVWNEENLKIYTLLVYFCFSRICAVKTKGKLTLKFPSKGESIDYLWYGI